MTWMRRCKYLWMMQMPLCTGYMRRDLGPAICGRLELRSFPNEDLDLFGFEIRAFQERNMTW